ncbi:MAG: efflux RND transporter periplasmic adaptor subunit [Pseudomonadota bacterium]
MMENTFETREKKPSAGKGLLFVFVLFLVFAGLYLASLALRSEEGPRVAQTTPVPISAAVVEVVLQGDFDLEESYTGLITPRRESELGFTAGGQVASLNADVGDRVSAGERMARLDTRSLRAQLAAAEATIDEAIASRELAMTTVERQRSLRDEGFVSQQVVDEFAAQASAADARLQASRAQADTLRVQIDLAEIRAPYDGVVTERFVDEGVIAAPGQGIFTLVETGTLEARIGVPASAMESLVPGQTYLLDVGGSVVEATLRAETGVIDDRQRTVTTVFEIADGQVASTGAVARLALNRSVGERGLWVPVSALKEASRGLWSIYVANPDDGGYEAQTRLVEIVHTDGPRAFVRGALENGDLVVIDGLQRITPGQPISPKRQSASSALAGMATSQDR